MPGERALVFTRKNIRPAHSSPLGGSLPLSGSLSILDRACTTRCPFLPGYLPLNSLPSFSPMLGDNVLFFELF
eukprot:5484835-Pleurochrysis_carterae.AAC.2